jgi:hypothetical protein
VKIPVFNLFRKRRETYDLARNQQLLDTFGGYNHNLRIREGEWYHEEHMSASEYPILRTSPSRAEVRSVSDPGGLIAKDNMAIVEGVNVKYGEDTIDLGLTAGTKQLISMGAYLLIWPDKKYVNTQDLTDKGSLEASVTTGTTVSVTLCRQDGTSYGNYTISATAPESPSNGDMWLDTSNAEVPVLKEYSAASSMWVTIPTTYVKIAATGIGARFEAYDGVEINGFTGSLAELNGSHVLYAVDDDYIVTVGVIDQSSFSTDNEITVTRSIPDMDYVCESGNRLWGCKYGVVNGKAVNELYASKLGDPKNWNCFMGLSTDSWSASRGSDGVFTGAISYQDHPMFFKENCIEKVYPSATGAHQVVTVDCRGVQNGSWRSLVIVNEVLYYKSIKDVCAFTGSLPASVSGPLGDQAYSSARAGAVDGVLYISMYDGTAWQLFTYDTARQIWHREDSTQVQMFAERDGILYCIDEAANNLVHFSGAKTGDRSWSITSGVIGLEMAENKYVTRYVIRLDTVGSVHLDVRYDDGAWEDKGTVTPNGMGSIVIPVAPKRFDHMQYRLIGTKHTLIYSIAKYVQIGSDVHW